LPTLVPTGHSTSNPDHASQSGSILIMALKEAQSVKDSFSQGESRYAIVTRSPNYWCASSCVTILAILSVSKTETSDWSRVRYLPSYDTAPALHRPRMSGTAIMSNLGSGYYEPNVFSCEIIARAPISRAKTPPLIS
jgi:hypothetical protein